MVLIFGLLLFVLASCIEYKEVVIEMKDIRAVVIKVDTVRRFERPDQLEVTYEAENKIQYSFIYQVEKGLKVGDSRMITIPK
jgi:hypothetical protein